jgi:dTDP-4-amino-4,6-dideoxygalactose transaminase
VGPGDEVITVPATFVATVAAIGYTGAKAVLVDVDPKTFTLDPAKAEKAVTKKTKAILPVHLYGRPAEMGPIRELATKHNLMVIEDAAQAHGAEYKGRRTGSLGDLACFSFYPGKNLGAVGEGGAVTTNDQGLAKRVRMLRDFGAEKKYHHELKGYNYRLEGMQGAVLRVKLKHLEAWTEARRAYARDYDERLKGSGVETLQTSPDVRHVYHIYAVLAEGRDALQKHLEGKGIHTNIHYPTPVHLQSAYADLGYKAGDFPVSEALSRKTLSLPLYPEMTKDQIGQVAEEVARGIPAK